MYFLFLFFIIPLWVDKPCSLNTSFKKILIVGFRLRGVIPKVKQAKLGKIFCYSCTHCLSTFFWDSWEGIRGTVVYLGAFKEGTRGGSQQVCWHIKRDKEKEEGHKRNKENPPKSEKQRITLPYYLDKERVTRQSKTLLLIKRKE